MRKCGINPYGVPSFETNVSSFRQPINWNAYFERLVSLMRRGMQNDKIFQAVIRKRNELWSCWKRIQAFSGCIPDCNIDKQIFDQKGMMYAIYYLKYKKWYVGQTSTSVSDRFKAHWHQRRGLKDPLHVVMVNAKNGNLFCCL